MPRGLAHDGQTDLHALGRHRAWHAITPLDEAHAAALKILVCAKFVELRLSAQAVGVEVVDWQPTLVLLNQYEGRTADNARVGDAQPGGDGSYQVRLARSQRPD